MSDNKKNNVPWIGLIIVFSGLSFWAGMELIGNSAPMPSRRFGTQCNNYCQGVARGGTPTWDKYGFACLCGDMTAKPWEAPSAEFKALFKRDVDAGEP